MHCKKQQKVDNLKFQGNLLHNFFEFTQLWTKLFTEPRLLSSHLSLFLLRLHSFVS